MTALKILWLESLLSYLNIIITQSIQLFCDSMSAIHIAMNLVMHERTKYIEIDCHFIIEKVLIGVIRPKYINTKKQPVDLLTKALHPTQFKYLLSKLNIRNIYV